MRKYLVLTAIITILIISGITSGCSNGRSNGIILYGNVEVNETRLSFKIPGILEERAFSEGQKVNIGDLIARLYDKDQQLAVNMAQANLDYAQSVLDELNAGSRQEDIQRTSAQVKQAEFKLKELIDGSRRQEIANAESALKAAISTEASARTQHEQAERDFQRYKNLFDQGVVSRRDFETVETGWLIASENLEKATAGVLSAEQTLDLVREGPRDEQIAQARANLEQVQAVHQMVVNGPRDETVNQAENKVQIARESLNQAKQNLDYTKIHAPFSGIIMDESAENGEYLNPGSTVVTIADLKTVEVRAFVNERDLGHVKIGNLVKVKSDTYPDKFYQGTVSYISDQAEFTPKTVQTTEERVKLVYMLKIKVDNPDLELKPGMPVTATIETGETR